MHAFSRFHDRMWQWFVRHAHSRYALLWLILLAFFDTFLSPFPTELYLSALMIAHPERWWKYLSITIIASTAGAAAGFILASILFVYIGVPVIHAYHLQGFFMRVQHVLQGHTFLTMSLAPLIIPIPIKVLIYAAGFLHVRFIYYILGFFLGYGIRISIVTYLAGRYGKRMFSLSRERVELIAVGVLSVLVFYGIVHWHLLPL